MAKTKIEWAEKVWNPVTGCTKVSEGCDNCYGRSFAPRLAANTTVKHRERYEGFNVALWPERLEQPLGWTKPCRIFVCSMGDLFHEDVPIDFIAEVFNTMAAWRMVCRKKDCDHEGIECSEDPEHKYLILTKRPERARQVIKYEIAEYIGENWPGDTPLGVMFDGGGWPLDNVWLGVSVENQARADERIPILLDIPAAVRFVSIEPMLAPVDLYDRYLRRYWICDECGEELLSPDEVHCCFEPRNPWKPITLDWVIVGGESGPGARPMLTSWARSVRDQCVAAQVPFFFKQLGEYWSLDDKRKGKKKSPKRELDGRTWEQYPEVR